MKSCCKNTPVYIIDEEDGITAKCASKDCNKLICEKHFIPINFLQGIDEYFSAPFCIPCSKLIMEKFFSFIDAEFNDQEREIKCYLKILKFCIENLSTECLEFAIINSNARIIAINEDSED